MTPAIPSADADLLALAAHYVRSAPDLVYVYDLVERRMLHANDRAEALLGVTGAVLAATGDDVLARLAHPDDAPRLAACHARLRGATDAEVVETEFRVRHPSGEWRWLAVRDVVCRRDDDGRARCVLGSARDVTHQKRSDEALRESRSFVEEVFRVAPHTVYVFDRQTGCYFYENRSIAALLGHHAAEGEPMRDSALEDLIHPDDYEEFWQHLLRFEAVPDGTCLEVEYRLRHACGDWRWFHARESVLNRDETGEVAQVVGVMQDITERIELDRLVRQQTAELKRLTYQLAAQKDELELANHRLEQLAESDSLTGLRNHGAMQARLEAEFTHARRVSIPLAVVMVDVDHFKSFNDTWGHPAGDRVLQRVAELMRASARDTDLVARYGGEEFALVLPATDRVGAMVVAERVRAAIEGTQGLERRITASLGVAVLDAEHVDPASLLAAADQALYHAKRGGRNRVSAAWDAPQPAAVAA
jgi:diguanylate cyclase (GGDEF)-like protein/PAS domain S-box-containing protein